MANRDLTPWTGGRSFASFARDPFAAFRRDIDRLFNEVYAPAEGRSFGAAADGDTLWPSVAVVEAGPDITVTAELPGLSQNDIDLELRDNALIISGEKKKEYKDDNGGRFYLERAYARFKRIIPLAAEVDADHWRPASRAAS